jgi:hypothetical protein
MADIEKRLKYYNGQFLQEQDFTAEQEYHLDRARRHNRQLHVPGVAEGLNVTATVGATSASVSPGTALNNEGQLIVLAQPRNVAFEEALKGQWTLVVISYAQEGSDDATVGDAGKTRWLERPEVKAILETGAPSADIRIRLARLRIAANGTIAEVDTTVRTLAGVKLRPEETLERLRLSRQGVTASQWPVLSSGAAGRADLAGALAVNGALSVTGNITVTGNVDGRDVSADGALNDTHRGRIDNPHTVTAAQVGAIASIDGVSNPGGNIDFVGQGGISITPDDAGNLIAFSTSPAALGALPAGDYLKRATSYLYFGTGDGNGAAKVVTCNFQPKYVWATAHITTVLGGYYHTVISPGFARIESTSSWSQSCHRTYVTRYAGAPYFSQYGSAGVNGIAAGYYYDNTQSPNPQNYFTFTISQVTSTGFTVTFERTNYTGSEAYFWMEIQLAILG